MEIIVKYSNLHRQLRLEEYSIPFKYLDEFDNKEEFIDYIEYFQIDKYFLLRQILECKYLEYLDEYLKDDIVKFLKHRCLPWLKYDELLEYISQYIEITELYASYNPNITTVKPFAKTLKILYAVGNCGIDDNGLKYAYNIEKLDASHNPNITTVKPFAKTLKILYANGNCGIDDDGLLRVSNLQTLYAYNNTKITTIIPFARTLKKLYVNDNSLMKALKFEELISSYPKITQFEDLLLSYPKKTKKLNN